MARVDIRYDRIDDEGYLRALGASLGIGAREQERYAGIRRLSKALRLASAIALLGLVGLAGVTGGLPGAGPLMGAVAVFIVDYAVYRYRAQHSRRAFVHHLLLHKQAGGIERKFSAEVYDRDFSEDERRGLLRADEAFFERPGVPLNFPLRVRLVSHLISRLHVAGRRLLDVGVLFGYFSELYLNTGNRVVSLDIYTSGLQALRRRRPDSACVAGNARAMPLRSGAFDFVSCLEVEHVADPVEVLREVARVLAPGGRCLLTTDNLQEVSLSCLCNPLVAVERVASFFLDIPLPLAATGSIAGGYSTAFTRRDIEAFSRAAGLRVGWCASYFFLLEAHVLIERLFGVTRGPYATRWTRVEHVLRAIPVVRWFGHHWVFVLEKRAE